MRQRAPFDGPGDAPTSLEILKNQKADIQRRQLEYLIYYLHWSLKGSHEIENFDFFDHTMAVFILCVIDVNTPNLYT